MASVLLKVRAVDVEAISIQVGRVRVEPGYGMHEQGLRGFFMLEKSKELRKFILQP